ncbi:hypothetical protein [Pradoshia sp. D12]|uniref:hypothetical protein n=1 Tax=Pradoshia sp. D12 TaxID=2651284 RepID=UPI00178C17E0|nr:hypothetical protein [Pradoshia sp. D12]
MQNFSYVQIFAGSMKKDSSKKVDYSTKFMLARFLHLKTVGGPKQGAKMVA